MNKLALSSEQRQALLDGLVSQKTFNMAGMVRIDTTAIMKEISAAIDSGTRAGSCGVSPRAKNDVYRMVVLPSEVGPYAVVKEDYACGWQFTISKAPTLRECARECSESLYKCTMFSYGGGLGCRLSACNAPDAVDKNKKCGFGVPVAEAAVDAEDLAGACAAQDYLGSTLYRIPKARWEKIQSDSFCQWQWVHPTPKDLNSVRDCAKACKASGEKCKMFSFGTDNMRCRIAACNDPAVEKGAQAKECGFGVIVKSSDGKSIGFAIAEAKRTQIDKVCSADCHECSDLNMCAVCGNSKFLLNGECASLCPTMTVGIGVGVTGRYCKECPVNCDACTSGDQCKICGNRQYNLNGACVSRCPDGHKGTGEGTAEEPTERGRACEAVQAR